MKNLLPKSNVELHKRVKSFCTATMTMVLLFVVGMAVATSSVAMAQSSTVKGKVADTKGEPIIGATISVKGTTNAVLADVNGLYELKNVGRDAILVFKMMGYIIKETKVDGRTNIDMVLEDEVLAIDNVIVVGYGKSTQKRLASSVATIQPSSIEGLPVVAISQSLAGRAPGLIVTQSGGGINANGTVSIRGGGTPLVVINNVISSYNDFILMNPADIASFTILKDAAATAVYGARGGDGIIVVTTKQGSGKPTIRFTSELMMTQPTFMEGKLNSYEIASVENDLRKMYSKQTGLGPKWSEQQLEAYRTGSDPYNYPNTDWQSLALSGMAPQQKYNLSVQGGSEISSYYLSIGILDQGTIFKDKTNDQQRYNFRFQQSSTIKDIGLKITPAIEGYIEETRAPLSNTASGGIDNYYYALFSHVTNKSPMLLGLNKDGQYYSGTVDNPLAEMSSEAGYHKRSNTRVRGQLDLEWALPWVEGLTLRASGNYSAMFNANKMWNKSAPTYSLEGIRSPDAPISLQKSSGRGYDWTLQYFVNYDRTFAEKHFVSFTGGYEANYSWSEDLWAERSGYLIPIDQMGSGPAASQKNSSGEREAGRAGWVGRLKYEFDNKYIAEATVRYDGSDLFPADKRWGLFYSGSLAWVISNEKFFQKLKDNDVFNYMKIRASYGQTGLSEVGRFAYLSSYGYDPNGYILGGSITPTFWEGAMPSPDISWYTRNTLDIGLDFESLGGRLRGSIDYYYMVTEGYLASPSNTSYTDPLGFSLPIVRSNGQHRREGVDFGISWRDKVGEFEYEVGGNFTYFDQLVARTWTESESDIKNPYKRATQQVGYAGVGYLNMGYYQNSMDVMNAVRRISSNNIVAGDIKYQDFNGDGKIDGSDQIRIGKNNFPRANYGIYGNFKYKGFYLNVLFQGATDRDIAIGATVKGNSGQAQFMYGLQLDYWTPENKDARFPRPKGESLDNNGLNYVGSDFWYVNGSYIRLKSAELGYDFKHKLLGNVRWLSQLRLGLSGNNLFTISEATKYGYDPETSNTDNYGYPVVRTYAISLNIGF